MRKDCGNIADIMWNTGGPAADATSECTTGPPYTRPSPSVLGHSKSRNGKWEMRNGKRGNGEMERRRVSVKKDSGVYICCAK